MIRDTPEINSEELEQPTEIIDPYHLDLDVEEMVRTHRSNIRASIAFYQEKDLYSRQEKNKEYYLGKQREYNASNKSSSYKENIIYEGISRQKPIELSRLPDLTVEAGNNTPESKETALMLSKVINSDIKKRSNRKLLGLAIKQEPLYFFSAVKARWNPEKGLFGDYEFVNVHPDNLVWDHNCPDNDANKMRFVAEKSKMMLKEMIMMFPDKENEILAEYGWDKDSDDSTEQRMASPVNVWEVWFHWYKLKGKETERIDGVMWLYGDTLLKKMKNPYFDYQGRKKTFSAVMEEKQAATIDEILMSFDIQNGEEIDTPTVYNNYFQDPEKPYFFMVYENMGEHPIGETSRIEQVLDFQDSLNQSGAIIQDMNIRSRGKDIFDTNAISQDTLDSVNIYNVDQVLGIDVPAGQSINNVHSRVEQKPATQQQYRSMDTDRQKAFEIIGVGASSRGLSDPGSTLGESQMAREADYGVIDDIVEDTINACAEWQARWSLQFVKLFYTKPHMRHIMGKDGDVLHAKLTQDMVDDGMEVVVSASGVDKMMRKRMAMENMKMGIGDPLSYYEDTEQSNPKERALRAMMAQGSPQMYIQQYLMDKPTPEEAGPAAQQAMEASPGGQPPAPEQAPPAPQPPPQ
jgi:hypothetical protein